MTAQGSYSHYFEDALRIHAICVDTGRTENDARLLTYMHAKASESERGIDYFLSPSEEDADALEIMLGKSSKKVDIPPVANLDKKEQDAIDLILTIADRISRLDAILAKECGLENRLSGELTMRLRLYRDTPFRNKMIEIYKNEIVPRFTSYDQDRIDTAFSKFRETQRKTDVELLEMAGIKKTTGST